MSFIGQGQLFHNFPQADLAHWPTVGQFNIALFNDSLATSGIPTLLATGVSYPSIKSSELPTGGGYAAGGLPISSLNAQINEYEASGWATQWVSGEAGGYFVGDIVKSGGAFASGFLFECVQAGPATGSAPATTAAPVVGQLDPNAGFSGATITGALFICCGPSITVFTTVQEAQWTATGGNLGPARYAVIYDTITQFNALFVDMLSDLTAVPGAPGFPNQLTLQPDPVYGWFAQTPR